MDYLLAIFGEKMKSKIVSVAVVNPEYSYSTDNIIKYVEIWTKDMPETLRKRILKIFKAAQIDRKFSILPIEQIFSPMTFEEKNNHYKKAAIELGAEVFQKALAKADLQAIDVDYIITTSCTGYMIPSLDAYLLNKFKMKKDVQRLPVTEMGCSGGTAGLIYANHFLKSNPDKIVAVISVEIPSITFQYNDFSLDNIVGSALFADGAACVILAPENSLAPEIIDTQMYNLPDTTDILGFNLTDSGFKIVLKEKLPDKIMEHFDDIVLPFLERNNLSIAEVNNFIFHPGGKKIITMIDNLLIKFDKNLNESKEIMRLYGNMSSATVLFILEKFMQKNINKDEYGLMLSFGPGFIAQSVLLKWS